MSHHRPTDTPGQHAAIGVRRASATDAHALAELFDAYCRLYDHPTNLDRARQFVTDRLRNRESVIFLAIQTPHQPPVNAATPADERPVGFCQLYPKFSSHTMQRDWILNDLFVAPGHRRQGCARTLVNAARAFAEDTMAAKLALKVRESNRAAVALYESMGWTRERDFVTYTYHLHAHDDTHAPTTPQHA